MPCLNGEKATREPYCKQTLGHSRLASPASRNQPTLLADLGASDRIQRSRATAALGPGGLAESRGAARLALHLASPSHDSARGVSPFLYVHLAPPRELENLAAKSMARRGRDDDDDEVEEEEDEEEAYDLDEEEEDEEDDYEEEARRGKASRGGGGGGGKGGGGRKRSREDNFIDDSAIEDEDEEDEDDDGGARPRKKGGGGVRGFFDEEAQVDEDEEEEDDGEGEDGEWSLYVIAS
jgi:hypothetical protein